MNDVLGGDRIYDVLIWRDKVWAMEREVEVEFECCGVGEARDEILLDSRALLFGPSLLLLPGCHEGIGGPEFSFELAGVESNLRFFCGLVCW